jgi:hypothetical protein
MKPHVAGLASVSLFLLACGATLQGLEGRVQRAPLSPELAEQHQQRVAGAALEQMDFGAADLNKLLGEPSGHVWHSPHPGVNLPRMQSAFSAGRQLKAER